MVSNGRLILCLLALAGGLVLGCQPPASEPLAEDLTSTDASASTEVALPLLETYADSVAWRVYEASGGPAALAALPYLGFKFGVQREQERGRVIRHFWDRRTGDYRLEFPGPANVPYVAIFNVNTREGQAYWQGSPLDTTDNANRMNDAYRRFINDTYWLMAPFKLFDPGVNRTYLPDSSDAEFEVLHLTFGDVGLTPGDQYWIYVDKETGRMARWAYRLQGDAPDAPPRAFVWEDYEQHDTAAGPLYFATRKRGVGVPYAILTDGIETPTQLPDSVFTRIEAFLTPQEPDS